MTFPSSPLNKDISIKSGTGQHLQILWCFSSIVATSLIISHCIAPFIFWSSRNSFKRMCYLGDDDVSTHLCIWYRHQHDFFFTFRETGLESAQSKVIIVCLRYLERRRRCRECDTGFQLDLRESRQRCGEKSLS